MTQTTTRVEPAKPAEPDRPSPRPVRDTEAARSSAGSPRRGYRFFLAMVGLVALHVADDSFLQPQPGTSAGDHLVSGLVPLTMLGLAAAVYPRVRGGARAAIALLVGVFGIVAGIEAAHYTTQVGPSGDDFTGLLCLPAGACLIGLGLVTLWTTRRRHGGVARRVLRRGAIGVAAAFLAVFGVFPIGYAYVRTHAARPPAGGWPPHGYGVLIFDRRGEGESDGDPNPYAWDEGELDLLAAIDFLKERPDVEPGRIGGLGLSVGGETFLQAAAHSEDLEAVVSEGASVRSVGELLSVSGSQAGPVAINTVITAATAVFSDSSPPTHLVDLVDEIAPRAMFLIYSPKDDPDEERFNTAFYQAAGRPKAIWEVPEAGHVGAQDARPREYDERVTRFFDQTLGKEGP